MKLINLFILSATLAAMFLLTSCGENVLPDPIDGEVQYYFEGKIQGESVKWEAGKETYYMSVNEVSSPFNPDMTFFGKIRKPSDSNRNAIEIYFENPLLHNTTSVDTFFQPRDFLYRLDNTSSGNEPVILEANVSATGTTSYSWDFGDGTFSSTQNVAHLFPNPAQEYTIKLTSQTTNGQNICSSEIIQKITPEKINCRSDFTYNPVGSLEREIQFSSAEDLYWDFGDGSPEEYGKTPLHLYSSKGVFTVTAQTDTGQACYSNISKNIPVGNVGGCGVNFTVSQPVSPQNQRVTIVYKDSGGKVFSSRNAPQPVTAFFALVSSENKTESLQKIKKLTLAFTCEVISNDGERLLIESEKSVFAVAIP